MDAVDAKCDELGVMDAICYAVCEGQKLEEKLNAANDRIKRLEEAGDGLLAALKDDWSEYVEWINESTDAVGKWNRAKESKP
jgi:hypothetical protein